MGRINYLCINASKFFFDKAHIPHIQPADICGWFNASQSTIGNKAKSIRSMLKMDYYNHQWILRSRVEKTSFVWMVEYKWVVLDARTLPLNVQIVAYQKGMIPYVPALENPKS